MSIKLPTILRTARAGSPARAWGMFVDGGWLDAVDDPKALTLKGRLIKDQAKAASGEERLRLFREAGAAYEAACHIQQGSYPLINAAMLALMGGDGDRSRTLAADVITMLENNPDEAETPYWLAATRSEALLLLGREDEAKTALAEAMQKAPQAWEDHAATLGQFRLIAAELGADAGWLGQYQPPASLHFQGIMQWPEDDAALRGEIDDWLAAENVGFGYGALAAGADIVIAEALVARGAELHVILPCDRANFRAKSVEFAGGNWAARFDALIERADSIDCLDAADAPFAQAVALGEAVCMGLARKNAANLQSEAILLRIDRRVERPKYRFAFWDQSGGRSHILHCDHDIPAPKVEITGQGELTAMLAVRGGASQFTSLPVLATASHEVSGITLFEFSALEDAWHAAKSMALTAPMAIDQALVSGDIIQSALLIRCRALCEIAVEDQILASKAAAFPLLARDATIRVEEAGEIRAAIGSFPAYAIISSS